MGGVCGRVFSWVCLGEVLCEFCVGVSEGVCRFVGAQVFSEVALRLCGVGGDDGVRETFLETPLIFFEFWRPPPPFFLSELRGGCFFVWGVATPDNCG